MPDVYAFQPFKQWLQAEYANFRLSEGAITTKACYDMLCGVAKLLLPAKLEFCLLGSFFLGVMFQESLLLMVVELGWVGLGSCLGVLLVLVFQRLSTRPSGGSWGILSRIWC